MTEADRLELEATIEWMRANGVEHLEYDGMALTVDLRHAVPSKVGEVMAPKDERSFRDAAKARREAGYGPRLSGARPKADAKPEPPRWSFCADDGDA